MVSAPHLTALTRALRQVLSFRGPGGGPTLGAWLVIACVVELFGLALWPRIPLAPWLGPAVLLAILAPVGARLAAGAEAWWKTALEYVVVLAVFAGITSVVWGFAIRGRIPIDTGDHQIMFARAEAQIEALEAGHWLRWTNFQQGGDSLTDLYPFFVNLLLYLVHVFAKRGTPLLESYTVFIAVAWWIRLAATYALTRRFAGIPIAFILAVAGGLDVGNDVWDGAWYGAIYWGMVHANVALSMAMLAMAAQVDLVRRFTPVRFVVCALSVAVAAFAHPLGIMVAGASTVAYVAAWASARELRKETLWVVVASGLGLLLAAPWILSFAYGQKHFGFSNAVAGVTLRELSDGLFNAGAPISSFRAWTGFVAVAVIGSILTREPTLVAPGLCGMLFTLLPVIEMMMEAGTFTLMPGLLDGQQRRMLTVAKLVSMPAAAWLFQLAVGRYLSPTSLAVRQVASRAIVLIVLALGPARLVLLALTNLTQDLRAQVDKGSGGKRERSHTGSDYDAMFRELVRVRKAEKSPTPFRVALNWTSVLRHASWGEGFKTGVPVVDYINAAANFLRIRPRELTEQGFHDWNIRYFIAERSSPPFPHMTERLHKGRFTLYELDSYDDRFVVAPAPVTISGLRVGEGRIDFDVHGAGPSGAEVTVRSAWYPRWRVKSGGSALHSVPPHPGAKPAQEQIALRVNDGHVVLECDGAMPGERPGYVLSLIAVLSLGVLGRSGGRARVRGLLERARERWLVVRERFFGVAWRRLASIDRRARLALGAAAGVLCLALVYFGFGRRVFLLSPPLIPGPTIRVGSTASNAKPCERGVLSGVYTCARDVTVYNVFGAIPFNDDTWEFARLFPAVGVNFGKGAGTVIRIAFTDVGLSTGRLTFRHEATAEVRVDVRVNGHSVGKRNWKGGGIERYDVPAGRRSDVELILSPEAAGAVNIARIER